jgi:DNA-binding MarR family transcriptional regulator
MSRSDSPHRTHSHGPDRNRSGPGEPDVRGPGAWPDEHSPQPNQPAPQQRRDWPLPLPPLESSGEPTAMDLAEALLSTAHAFKQWGNLCFSHAGPGLRELSVPRGRVLGVMAHAMPGRVRMGDLSSALGVTPRNVTTIVDGLEREGLLARQPDPGDRRAILLELTEKGRAQVEQVHGLQHNLAEHMFSTLNPDERCTLFALLTRLARRAQQATSSRDQELAR